MQRVTSSARNVQNSITYRVLPSCKVFCSTVMTTEPRRVAIVCGLKSSAAQVEHADPPRLVRRMSAEYRKSQLYEWYQSTTVGKVAFDVDGKSDTTTAPKLLADALAGVATFFGSMPSRYIITASHGAGPGHYNGDKLSFRIVVAGVRMQMKDVKARLVRLGLDRNRPFDAAIYGANQKLRMAGSIKTQQDKRPLVFIDDRGQELQPTPQLFMDSIVQVVEDEWELLEEPQTSEAVVAPVTKRVVEKAPDAAPTIVKRGRPCKSDTLPSKWRDLLESMGFTEVKSQKAFSNDRGHGYAFSSSSRKECPCCTRSHDSNNWWAVKLEDGTFLVKSHSENCRYKRVDPSQQDIVIDNTTIQQKVDALQLAVPVHINTDPNLHYHTLVCYRPECLACEEVHGDAQYRLWESVKDTCWILQNCHLACCGKVIHATGQLNQYVNRVLRDPSSTTLTMFFLAAHQGSVWCDKAQADIRLWKAGKWTKMSPGEFAAYAGSWLNTVIGCVKQMDEYAMRAKEFKEVQSLLNRSFAQQRSVACNILSVVSLDVGSTKFDCNPNLLGCEDCVIDLQQGEARSVRKEDLVSKSVGYCFLDRDPTGAGALRVAQIMQDIYPVQEEREFMQLFAGYCLRGDFHEKIFLCLTDRRTGNNGKSTFVRLLIKALGTDYAVEGDDALLYQTKASQSVNSHTSGLLFYKDKRLATFEELSDKQTLDKELLKKTTGGGASVPVRAAHSTTTVAMEWTSKLLMAFNEGCFPKFRAEDDALVRRMVVMEHRSLFAKDEAEYEKNTGQPHTFMVDPAREQAITGEDMLAWMLEGLQRYRTLGFKHVPQICEEWKRQLVLDHDDIAAWAAVHLEKKVGSILALDDALKRFQQDTDLQEVGKKAFSARLKKLFPNSFQAQKRLPGGGKAGAFIGVHMEEY